MKTVTVNGIIYEDAGTGTLTAIGEVEPSETAAAQRAAEMEAPSLPPESAAFRGLAGDVVAVLEPGTEADPVGMLLHVEVKFGSMVGAGAHFRIGSAVHPPSLFVTLVGRSSHSRKGTAREETDAILNPVEDSWSEDHEVSGFGSGEAFIEHAAEHPGAALLIDEVEMARVFATAAWDASTVSSTLRRAFDYRPLEHRVRKGKPLKAPRTPTALVGHITAEELRDPGRGLRPVEIANGFGNRLLWAYVDRRRLVPRPSPLDQRVVNDLTRQLRRALDAGREAGEMRRNPEAEELWDELYARLQADETGVPVVDQLTARAPALLARLSMIYALLDLPNSAFSAPPYGACVGRAHLESAWEVWRYCRWSVQHIWLPNNSTGDRDVDRVLDVLEGGEQLVARDLDRMFQGHRSSATIRDRVLATGRAELISEPTAGASRKVLRHIPYGGAEKAEEAQWWRTLDFKR